MLPLSFHLRQRLSVRLLLGKAMTDEEKQQKAAENEWEARRRHISERHAAAAAARETEMLAQGAKKEERLEEIGYVRKSSMMLRAEESKLRRNERMDHVQRMQVRAEDTALFSLPRRLPLQPFRPCRHIP
eukprot:SAG22_NODE_962_length_6280_cov_4.343472_7_plen_130_part_00